MRKINVPKPPVSSTFDALEQIGTHVGYIWILTDKGAATIETQYKTARQLQESLGVSRATAYRLISRHPVRYWCSDCRDAEHPKCYSVLPTKVVDNIHVYHVGNPNFCNGIYQQAIARRQRVKR